MIIKTNIHGLSLPICLKSIAKYHGVLWYLIWLIKLTIWITNGLKNCKIWYYQFYTKQPVKYIPIIDNTSTNLILNSREIWKCKILNIYILVFIYDITFPFTRLRLLFICCFFWHMSELHTVLAQSQLITYLQTKHPFYSSQTCNMCVYTDNIPYKPKTPFNFHKHVIWCVYSDKEHSINTIMTDQLRLRITFVDNNNCYCGQRPVA